ncbi:MAG: NAD(P)-dependent oxidoreductase [Gammaproteobacteria bacterium]|nr:NAD(P)-dependent oxidoreductase [Gammaproteobacteria bacterium]MCY4282337.1 NAD(P)-dependent oxidoreductase [Gammaproteobacteria bacterium]
MALTGATGFVGSNLLTALVNSGYLVKALTRRPQPGHERIRWINGDLNKHAALAELVDGCTGIIHCAGITRGNSLAQFLQVNLNGTQNLLAATRKVTPTPRFLLVSSLAARYPHYSWYARSKADAETLLLSERYARLSRTIFRPTAVYGPGDKEMRPLFRLLRRGVLLASGAPTTRLSLIHVDDLTQAILLWLQTQAAQGLFELDDGNAGGYRWEDIASIGRDTWQRNVTRVQVPAILLKCAAHINLWLARTCRYPAMLTPGKVNEVTHANWVCDNAPLTTCIGWRPTIRLAEVLDSVV